MMHDLRTKRGRTARTTIVNVNTLAERTGTVRGMLLILLTLLAVAPGCAEKQAEAVREVPRNVRVLSLQASSLDEYFEISGPVEPVRGAVLSAEENGPVIALAAAKGARVEAGQVIVEQKRDILQAEMAAADAAAKAQEFNLDKVRRLFDAGKISEIELLNAGSAAAQARAAADVASERYARAAVSAPFAGVVTDRYVELGEFVPAGRPAVRLIDPYTLKLAAHLTDSQVAWVRAGDRAPVALGEGGERGVGVVTWVGLEADRATGKFPVELEIANPDLKLHAGVIGRARLPKNRVEGAVIVPRDAVLTGKLGTFVYVVEGDRALRRNVELGADQGLMAVVDRGLAPGDLLVVRGHRDLTDGALVAVTETATAPDGGVAADPAAVRAGDAGVRVGEAPTALSTEAGR
jgi:membrane fusion protein (multidrug efflux system)